VVAVVLGQLPGDWGFFGAYLTGGIVLGVLAVGSTAPGLLQVRYTAIIFLVVNYICIWIDVSL
jgi:hypothetical protein